MAVNFPPFNFPILRKLSFQFSVKFYEPLWEFPSNFPDNRFALWFLQSILNGAGNLQEFVIPFTVAPMIFAPVTFEFLRLPPTIVSLEVGIQLESSTLEIFFQRNQLPNLSHLLLQVHLDPFSDGLLYRILTQFRKNLKSFQVDGLSGSGGRCPRTYLRFPLMEKLEFVNIQCTGCELKSPEEPEQLALTCLQENLPKLDRLYLGYQTEAMLRTWIDKSKFDNVYDLLLSIVNESVSSKDDNYFKSPSLENMRQLNVTFPNVRELTLRVNISDLDFLESLFHNFGSRIEKLQIELQGRIEENSSDMLDSMLIGIPLSLVEALKEEDGVDILESVLVFSDDYQPSLRNLAELNTFSLMAETGNDGKVSLVSDLLFGQAFLKMPRLGYLYLDGISPPSEDIQREWKEQGRFMYLD